LGTGENKQKKRDKTNMPGVFKTPGNRKADPKPNNKGEQASKAIKIGGKYLPLGDIFPQKKRERTNQTRENESILILGDFIPQKNKAKRERKPKQGSNDQQNDMSNGGNISPMGEIFPPEQGKGNQKTNALES